MWIATAATRLRDDGGGGVAFFVKHAMNDTIRTKTLNNMGWMFKSHDPALDAFLSHVEQSKGYFADIGTAFGFATFEALKRGGRVLAIDLDQRHLNTLRDVCPSTFCSQLEIQCGHFPNTIDLAENSFDGILCSRVLIFLKADEIESALSKIYKALKLGGIFIYFFSQPTAKKMGAS